MSTTALQVRFDLAPLQAQLRELSALLEGVPKDPRKHLLDLVLGQIDRLLLDVVLSDAVPTPRADGTVEILYSLRLDAEFERLLSAVRAGEWNV